MKTIKRKFILLELLNNGCISRNFALKNYISRLGSEINYFLNQGIVFRTFNKTEQQIKRGLRPMSGDYVYYLKPTKQNIKLINKLIKEL